MAVNRIVYGKNAKPVGQAPAVVLENPKYVHNVAQVLRATAAYQGMGQVFFTGDRIQLEEQDRLPREERMKAYMDVNLIQFDYPLDAFDDATPVVVELLPNSIPLPVFEHPRNAVYIFGPEDGSVSKALRTLAGQFVYIPAYHCLNLSMAVGTVLYDRMTKLGDIEPWPDICEVESRGFIENKMPL